MSELDDIRSFVAVVDAGGFGRAGRSLGLSKSIVSRRVARLEADLGTRLLSRTTRGVSPTEAGLEFKARGERILAELSEAREAVALQAGGVTGRLRLTMPLTFGIHHVAPVLAVLAQRHPRLEIDVEASDRQVDLIGERFDMAIRIGVLKDSSLVARKIAAVRGAVVGSPDYFARHGRPGTPADLAGHDCLIYTGNAMPDWNFRVNRRLVSIRPNGRLRSDSGDTLLQWAEAGLGLAALPTFISGEAIRTGRLQHVLWEYPLPESGLYVVRPPGAYVPGKVRVLTDLLAEHFSGTPVWDPCQVALDAHEAAHPEGGAGADEAAHGEHQAA
ncbi:LysR family transcriptional regulator [Bosea sp. (in: a-proteobacteria)]|uniref:LysR family transcriptional regulator n=1 Tax=Bosea sp. (in: a-proteobacteria) TaxID=1871050 RepID=UPI002FC6B28A